MRDWQLCLVYANFITMQLRGRTQPQDPAQYPMNYDGRCHEWVALTHPNASVVGGFGPCVCVGHVYLSGQRILSTLVGNRGIGAIRIEVVG